MEKRRVTISIPSELYGRIRERSKAHGFASVDDYITFILEQLATEDEAQKMVSDADESEVKRRLKLLGYLD